MRYGYRVEMPGLTQEQYDFMHAQIGSIAGDTPGLLVHIAGPTEGGWCVTEVWASKADFDQFMAKMAPMMSSPDAPPMNIKTSLFTTVRRGNTYRRNSFPTDNKAHHAGRPG